MTLLIDVSHTVRDGLVTLRGFPAPSIREYLSREESRNRYAEGTTFHIGRIDMIANTGTYVDSPFHRYPDGADISGLPLASVANLPGMLFTVPEGGGRAIGASLFRGADVAGKAVIICTGWSRHFGSDRYFDGHPFLTEEAARHLADAAAALVGIDSVNIDDTSDGRRPAHSILLRRNIPIVEHLTNLSALSDRQFRFFAVPVKVQGLGTFPVRAFALLDEDPPPSPG